MTTTTATEPVVLTAERKEQLLGFLAGAARAMLEKDVIAARAALPIGGTVWDKTGRRYTVQSVGLNARAQVVVGVHEHKGFPATFYPADLLTADPLAALNAQPAEA